MTEDLSNSLLSDESIAGAVITFARLDYLEQCLDAIYSAKGSEYIDWHVFVDHPYDEKIGRYMDEYIPHRDIQEETVQFCKDHDLTFESITAQDENVDILGQKHDVHSLYDDYEYVMCFENDLIIGEDYLTNLHSATRRFSDYCVTMYTQENHGGLNKLIKQRGGPRLWGYEISREAFRKFEDEWNQYFELMQDTSYKKRIGNQNRQQIENVVGAGTLSHDVCLSRLIRLHTSGKLKPTVTRGRYIGKEGNYAYDPDFFEKKGMDDQPDQIEYDEDPIEGWIIE